MTCADTSFETCDVPLPGPSLAELCKASEFVVFMSYIDRMIRSNDKISGRCERVKSIEEPWKEYDFAVIGGGAGGAVVAGRLSENPDTNVLVIEAGHDEPPGGQIPLFTIALIDTEVDWNFTSTNEKYACLAANGSCSISAAKMLGGNTAHNGMAYNRGNPMDYNNWAAQGNEGWSWKDVKPFFLKSEDNGEIERVGRFYHATGGPLPVERFPYTSPLADSCLAAAMEAGYSISNDLNGEQITGFSIVQTTNRNGVRCSSAAAFLRPARNRKNFHVSLNSHATRIIVKGNKAVGVEYLQNGKLRRVRVSKEVILSAGTIMSPQILLLSGIGPKEHLKSVGIEVVKDLPGVGKNFHDHHVYMLTFTINERDEYDNNYDIAAEYLTKQTGPLSGLGVSTVTATLKTKAASNDYPDLQVYFLGYVQSCAQGKVDALASTGKRRVYLRAVNLRPRSRGRISLASNDPLRYPIIHGNYLSNSTDVNGVVEAIELALKLVDTNALQAHNFSLVIQPIKACSKYRFRSRKYWSCMVRYGGAPELHMAGTCKMGPVSDLMAVVDPQLRVYGIQGLRVADASIMPQVTSGNTAAPSMMIGERAAAMIKKYWGLETSENIT